MSLVIDHDQLVHSACQLPPLPQSAVRLASLLAADDPNPREIVRVVESDPALTMKLLRMANSAVAGSHHEIGTVQKAVLRLGTGAVAGFVVRSCVRPMVGKGIPGYNLTEEAFWRHSLAAALAAESIQAHSTKWTNTLAFTAALLHDIGKLVLGRFLDAEALGWLARAGAEGNQPAFAAERELLSLHHGEAGGIVAQHWGLPDTLVQGIVYHHDPDQGADAICFATYLANVVAHQLECEEPADSALSDEPPHLATALECLGLTNTSLTDIANDVRKALQAMLRQQE